jgi:membrane fusion protein, multidrug efflux system
MMASCTNRRSSSLALAAAGALAIAAALAGCQRDEPGQPPPPIVQLAPADLVVARTTTIEAGPQVSGTLEAAHSATVRAQLGGTIRAIGPELGQLVRRGDLLARIDAGGLGDVASSARAQLASASAQLELARREVERTRALVEAGAVARRELEQAESRVTAQRATVDQARAQLTTARDQLGDATLRAPMTGVVAQRAVNTGDVVTQGATLYQIIDPSSIRLAASVPSDEVAAVEVGHAVQFTVHGYPDETFTGNVARIAPSADPTTRQIAILVDLPNPSHRLLAGLFARGRIVAQRATGVAVPVTAVDARGDEAAVLRLTGLQLERLPVRLGLRDPERDLVLVTGLADGDRVLARPAAAPPPGSQVIPPRQAPPDRVAPGPRAAPPGRPTGPAGRQGAPAGRQTAPPGREAPPPPAS